MSELLREGADEGIPEGKTVIDYTGDVSDSLELLMSLREDRFTLLETGGFITSQNMGIAGFGRPIDGVPSILPGDVVVVDSIVEGVVNYHAERDGEKLMTQSPVDRASDAVTFCRIFMDDIKASID